MKRKSMSSNSSKNKTISTATNKKQIKSYANHQRSTGWKQLVKRMRSKLIKEENV